MKKNVGDFDAFLRITLGLSMLGVGIKRDSNPFILLGSMKVAEGLTRFCPLLYLMGISTEEDKIIRIR